MEYLTLALAVLIILLAITALLLSRKRIRDKKIFEARMNQLEAEKNTRNNFYAVISHELKGPMGSVFFLSSQLRERHRDLDENQVMTALDLINTSLEKANDLLENLLNWSLLQTGKIEVRPEKFELAKVIEENARLYQPVAAGKQVLIRQEIPGGIHVVADVNMTAAIFRNLLSNALHAMDKPGEIRIRCYDNGHETEIEVKDQGSGFHQEDLDKLFGHDVSQALRLKGDGKGTGFGLMLCREFAEKNGGWLKARSDPGKGSIFTFALKKP